MLHHFKMSKICQVEYDRARGQEESGAKVVFLSNII